MSAQASKAAIAEWRRGTKGNKASTGMEKPKPKKFWNTVVNLPDEEWRPFDEGRYAVSNMGRIKRIGFEYLMTPNRSTKQGHLQVRLRRFSNPFSMGLHRLVALTFIGPCPPGKQQVAHLDGNPANCRVNNLIWATVAENASHRKIHGTETVGSKMFNAVLTEEKVLDMRRLRASGMIYRKIGDIFGVNTTTAFSAIKKGWKHVPEVDNGTI